MFKTTIKAIVVLVLAVIVVPDAHALGSYDILLNPFIGKQRQLTDFEFDTCTGEAPMTTETLSSFSRLWDNDTTEVGFTAFARLMDVADNILLPSTGNYLPQTFAKLNLGPTFRHQFTNKWIFGVNAFAGSGSNEPFTSYNTLEISGNLSLLIPRKDSKSAWVFFINYSSNRDFWRHIPIPGFGYEFNSDWGRGFLGIPAMNVNFLPKSKINFNVRYFPIIRLYSDIGWTPSEKARLALFFEWGDDHYWRTDREYNDRQVFFVEKSVGSSLLLKLSKEIDFKLSGGWRFNRRIFEGRSILKDTDYNRVDLESSPFVGFLISTKIQGTSWQQPVQSPSGQ